MKKYNVIFAAAVGMVMAAISIGANVVVGQEAGAAPYQKSIIAMPHPDDETQAWSLIEGSTGNYKVFVYFTKGEQTVYCENSGYSGNGEVAPLVTNPGKWSKGCTDSRINSTLRFLNSMSTKDSAVPGGFSLNRVQTVFPNSQGKVLGHVDANGYFNQNSSAQVYYSSAEPFVSNNAAMGRVIFFSLGDGDLTTNEVTWALNSIKNEPWVYGLPSLPTINVVGPFRNYKYTNCSVYNNDDHVAVHQALWNNDFGAGWQAAATCASDPDVRRTGIISDNMWNGIAGIGANNYRTGSLQAEYGWLISGYWPAFSRYDANPQGTSNTSSPIMQKQSYWTRAWR